MCHLEYPHIPVFRNSLSAPGIPNAANPPESRYCFREKRKGTRRKWRTSELFIVARWRVKRTPALHRMRFRTPKQKRNRRSAMLKKRNAKRIRLTCSVATVLKTEKFELVVKFNSLIRIRRLGNSFKTHFRF
ncbi:hypothetical protein CEXT_632311 [Caerostris extrusa]|uniref:Uncharacterized protein n=1 Tax=Caerostris extrusa TaxID=172846 RepID=A0AAV4Y2Q3_CAEEX|nr:hypothetical protein CEXT_632311 [Caerostris extrusa]